MAITRLILRLAPENYLHSIENKILVKIKLKCDTGLHKNGAELDFFGTVVKIPALVSFFFGLKGLNV